MELLWVADVMPSIKWIGNARRYIYLREIQSATSQVG